MTNPEDITPEDSVVPVFRIEVPEEEFSPPPLREPSVAERRAVAYRDRADPVFFKWQRGEATEQDWRDAVQAVKDSIT